MNALAIVAKPVGSKSAITPTKL